MNRDQAAPPTSGTETRPPADDDRLHAAVERAQARQQGWRGQGIGAHLLLVGSLGITILVPVFAGLGLGWYVDRLRGHGAAGRLGLLLAGAGIGLWWAWRVMVRGQHPPNQRTPPP
jgi:ATP synthase protein I